MDYCKRDLKEILKKVRTGEDAVYDGWELTYNKMFGVYIGRRIKDGKIFQRKSSDIFAKVLLNAFC